MTHTDGGPAFPQPDLSGYGMGPVEAANGEYQMQGMSLRDWFAGQALVGIINACAMDTRDRGETTETMFARKAYSVADAMLAARSGGAA